MPNDIDLRGLRVAVTGGTSGLGLALVRVLAARGARVAFVARSAENVGRVARETGAYGIVGDVGRKEEVYPIALQIAGNLGGLDALDQQRLEPGADAAHAPRGHRMRGA